MTANEAKLIKALKNLISAVKPDETGGICLTDVEFAEIEANALIWELEHPIQTKTLD